MTNRFPCQYVLFTRERETVDQLATLEYGLDTLRGVVATLDDSQMDSVSNCEPWTVRQLASHALNNQLVWAGIATGQELVSAEDTMSGGGVRGRSCGLRRGRRGAVAHSCHR
jgi:hypothetical protein